MLEKIKSELGTKFESLGLDKEVFDGVASLGVSTVTDESGIAGFVDKAEPMLKAFQKEVDRRVNGLVGDKQKLEADRLALEEKLKSAPKPPATPDVGQGGEKIPEYLKELINDVKGLKGDKIQEQQTKSKNELLDSAEKLMIEKGVDKKFVRKALNFVSIDEGETAETLADKGVAENNTLQSLYTPEVGAPRVPSGAGGKTLLEAYAESKGSK